MSETMEYLNTLIETLETHAEEQEFYPPRDVKALVLEVYYMGFKDGENGEVDPMQHELFYQWMNEVSEER